MKERIIFYIQRYKLYIGIGVVFSIILVIYLLFNHSSNKEVVEPDLLMKEEKIIETEKTQPNLIKIDIKGAVNQPGVYEIEKDARVSDIIAKSGGLTNAADTSTINLSKVLEDEMVVIIYTTKEIEEMRKGSTSIKYVEKECICPKIENNACIENSITNNETEKEDSSSTSKDTNKEPISDKVNINNASLAQLMTLTGIGEVKAKDIIAYRDTHGSFKTIDEITKVKGIGSATYEKIKDRLTV